MSDEQILNIPRELKKIGVSGTVLIQWHGGEPLLVCPDRFERLILKINNNSQGINFLHGVQTNLVVLRQFNKNKRDRWYQVLSKYFDKDLIGVSWDYSIRGINLKSQQNFYNYFEQSFKSLRSSEYFKKGFSPTIIITAAKPFLELNSKLSNGMAFFKWLDYMQLHKIHIEKLTPTGDAIKNWSEIGVSNSEYSKLMGRLYLSYKRYKSLNPSSELAVSPFCDFEDAVKTGKQDNICSSGACQTSMFTFSSKGLVETCTAIAEHNNVSLKYYQQSVKANCIRCEFNHICNGGCPAHNNVVDLSGECSGAKKLLTTIKEVCNA
jgi:radical SAM protein with 4Fe4S-binding SPASM domain